MATWLIAVTEKDGCYNMVPVARGCLWYDASINIYIEGSSKVYRGNNVQM